MILYRHATLSSYHTVIYRNVSRERERGGGGGRGREGEGG